MIIQTMLKSQYHASLAMLLEAIQACPPTLWTSDQYSNPFWRVAYHTLYYTDLYLQPSETAFIPWEHHRPGCEEFDTGSLSPYSVDEITAYYHACRQTVDSAVDRLDLSGTESGFSWYTMPKLEHQLVNLRHIQHHTGQLADRLRQVSSRGIRWVGGMSEL